MASEQDLLAEVIACPADDAPRMVYADWLGSRGDWRGEFIRTQVAMARLAAGDPRRQALGRHEAQLLNEHGRDAAAALPAGASPLRFDRGFAVAVYIAAADLLRCAVELFGRAPIDDLCIGGVKADQMPSLAALRQLAPLRKLKLSGASSGNIGDEAVIALTRCTHAWNLEELEIGDAGLGPAGVSTLANWSFASGIKRLSLYRNALGDAGAAALAASPVLRRLESLNLYGCSIGRGAPRKSSFPHHL